MWHSQLAPWVEEGEWTAEELRQIIIDHVTEVAGYYRGKCYAWDVVNEALNEDGTYRESVFYEVLGEDYIKLAFEVAAEVDPEAKLYYNDYNLESPGPKAEGAVRIVEMLQEAGLKVDGIGMQAHLIAGSAPSLDDQIAVMESYAATGVEVAITELDVRIELPTNETNLEWQRDAYRDVSFPFSPLLFPLSPTHPHPSQGTTRLTGNRPSALASRSTPASASPSGTSTTPSAGSPTCSRARVPRCSGLRTLRSTPPTTALSRR